MTDTDQYAVLLDKRTLKTPGGLPLLMPKERLPVALLIAEEWENQVAVLKPHTLPMVSSTSFSEQPEESADHLRVASRLQSRVEH